MANKFSVSTILFFILVNVIVMRGIYTLEVKHLENMKMLYIESQTKALELRVELAVRETDRYSAADNILRKLIIEDIITGYGIVVYNKKVNVKLYENFPLSPEVCEFILKDKSSTGIQSVDNKTFVWKKVLLNTTYGRLTTNKNIIQGWIVINSIHLKSFNKSNRELMCSGVRRNLTLIMMNNLFLLTMFAFTYRKKVKEERKITELLTETSNHLNTFKTILNNGNLEASSHHFTYLLDSHYSKDKKIVGDIADSINSMVLALIMNIETYKLKNFNKLKATILREEEKIKEGFNLAFRRWIPDMLDNIEELNGFTIDSTCKVTPKDYSSGDGYFYKRVSDSLIFSLYDVSGHGVQAAFEAIILRFIFEEYFIKLPKILNLKNLAATLLERSYFLGENMCEVSLLEIDTINKEAKILLMGYQLILACKNHDDIHFVNIASKIPSLSFVSSQNINKAIYNQNYTTIPLTEDEIWLIFLTDGYHEAKDINGNVLGQNGVLQLLKEAMTLSYTSSMLEYLFNDRFYDVTGVNKDDDRSILVIKISKRKE